MQMLSGHIVASELPSTAVAAAITAASPNPAEVATFGGTTLEATTEAEEIFVSPKDTEIKAMVVVKDVQTCAGVVHVIDKVLAGPVQAAAPVQAADDKFAKFTAYAGKDYSPDADRAVMVEVSSSPDPCSLLTVTKT